VLIWLLNIRSPKLITIIRTPGRMAFILLFTLTATFPVFAQAATAPTVKSGFAAFSVRQGSASSSYFHASIAAIANATPDALRKAISHNPGGGFKVEFPDGSIEYVLAEDVQYTRAHNLDKSEGDWVIVIMRGYAQHALRQGITDALQNSTTIPSAAKDEALNLFGESGPLLVAYDRAIRATVNQGAPIVNGELKLNKPFLKTSLTAHFRALNVSATEYKTILSLLDDENFFTTLAFIVERDGEVFGAEKTAVEAGLPQRVLQTFMGTAYLYSTLNQDMTMKYLLLNKSGQAMTATTRTAAPDDLPANDWWATAHTYSVISYDEAAQTVTLRNPTGNTPAPDGVFTIPLATFYEAFSACSSSSSE
jgi:hypothetical protein